MYFQIRKVAGKYLDISVNADNTSIDLGLFDADQVAPLLQALEEATTEIREFVDDRIRRIEIEVDNSRGS